MVTRRDDGAALILTLIFTVVLAVVVLALAQFSATGVRTSDVATDRTETNFGAASAANWAIEEFAKKNLDPDTDCGDAPARLPITVPGGLVPNGYTAQLTCAQTMPITGEPVVHLVSTVTPPVGATRTVETTVEIPKYIHGARVADWRVDIPIDIPAYVTTTTTSSTTTTTTTTTTPNAPPVANNTTWTVNPGVSSRFLDAYDMDGTIASVNIIGLPAGWTIPATAGALVDLNATSLGPHMMTYTVTDNGGATSAIANLSVNVITGSTSTTTTSTSTTTTTLAPNPDCTFQLTSVHSNRKSGSGTLAISNLGGGAFDGWQVSVNPSYDGENWSFTWTGDVDVTGTYIVSSQVATASFAANQGPTGVATALVTDGGSARLDLGGTFACSVLSP